MAAGNFIDLGRGGAEIIDLQNLAHRDYPRHAVDAAPGAADVLIFHRLHGPVPIFNMNNAALFVGQIREASESLAVQVLERLLEIFRLHAGRRREFAPAIVRLQVARRGGGAFHAVRSGNPQRAITRDSHAGELFQAGAAR